MGSGSDGSPSETELPRPSDKMDDVQPTGIALSSALSIACSGSLQIRGSGSFLVFNCFAPALYTAGCSPTSHSRSTPTPVVTEYAATVPSQTRDIGSHVPIGLRWRFDSARAPDRAPGCPPISIQDVQVKSTACAYVNPLIAFLTGWRSPDTTGGCHPGSTGCRVIFRLSSRSLSGHKCPCGIYAGDDKAIGNHHPAGRR